MLSHTNLLCSNLHVFVRHTLPFSVCIIVSQKGHNSYSYAHRSSFLYQFLYIIYKLLSADQLCWVRRAPVHGRDGGAAGFSADFDPTYHSATAIINRNMHTCSKGWKIMKSCEFRHFLNMERSRWWRWMQKSTLCCIIALLWHLMYNNLTLHCLRNRLE